MASITLRNIPEDVHAQLKREAAANFRSLSQEALARIQRSFELDERLSSPAVNRLIQEALDSVFEVQERLFRWRHPEWAFEEDDDLDRAS